MKYQYIFFDLDGTLTDSGIGISNSVKYALRKLGYPVEEERVMTEFVGPPLWKSFHMFCDMTKEEAEHAVDVYREYFSVTGLFENEVYDGIRPMLDALKAKGYKMAIATSKPEIYSVQIVKHFQLDSYFEFVAGSTMDGSRVAKADVIRHAMDSLGLDDASKILMVGDREHDVLGAKQIGMDCVGVLWGYGSEEELKQAGADHIVSDPAHFIESCNL